jgi:hypothetical protein
MMLMKAATVNENRIVPTKKGDIGLDSSVADS